MASRKDGKGWYPTWLQRESPTLSGENEAKNHGEGARNSPTISLEIRESVCASVIYFYFCIFLFYDVFFFHRVKPTWVVFFLGPVVSRDLNWDASPYVSGHLFRFPHLPHLSSLFGGQETQRYKRERMVPFSQEPCETMYPKNCEADPGSLCQVDVDTSREKNF